MGAFIVAGLIFAATVAVCAVNVFADGMSDAPSQDGISPVPIAVGGTLLSLIVLASHWMPPIGW